MTHYFKNFSELKENFNDLTLNDQVDTFLAIKQKVVGYGKWDKCIDTKKIIVYVLKDRKTFLDALEKTGELHPEWIQYYRIIRSVY